MRESSYKMDTINYNLRSNIEHGIRVGSGRHFMMTFGIDY